MTDKDKIEKTKIQPVIVVEGRDDTANLKRFFDVETYETGGSAIDEDDIERLKLLQNSRGIMVFTDPDFQGERIRKIIMWAIPEAGHIFLNREEARPKGKGSLGVEHAKFEDLEKAFAPLLEKTEAAKSTEAIKEEIGQADLIRLGLILKNDSRKRREFLGEKLRIGYANGKQIARRLNMFGISLKEIEKVMDDYRN